MNVHLPTIKFELGVDRWASGVNTRNVLGGFSFCLAPGLFRGPLNHRDTCSTVICRVFGQSIGGSPLKFFYLVLDLLLPPQNSNVLSSKRRGGGGDHHAYVMNEAFKMRVVSVPCAGDTPSPPYLVLQAVLAEGEATVLAALFPLEEGEFGEAGVARSRHDVCDVTSLYHSPVALTGHTCNKKSASRCVVMRCLVPLRCVYDHGISRM